MADTLPLIQTKLHRPPLPKNLVARPRLTNLLDCRPQRPLTLLSAPAGYGKSTLISSWAENVDCPVAWVSLDEHDSDIGVFISYLLGAIQTIYPSAGADTWAMIQSPELPPLAMTYRTLINELGQIQTDFIVVLDDYHRIRSTNVHDLIEELLRHPPQNLHLVLGTRIDPSISLSNLRARSKVTEIRLQDLRFTEGEAAVLLERMIGGPVESTTVIEVEAKSEGWVTGLRLAALAMRRRLGRERIRGEISLHNRFVSEYLVSEVLSQQSEQLAEQMLKIAVLDRFCAGLCQAVCDLSPKKGEGDAESFIRWLEASNLFVIPLDDQGVWFRYHHLFQAFLEKELQRRFSAAEIAALHNRAGNWFGQNDVLEEAVHHALAAQNLDLAARFIEDRRIELLFRQKWHRIQGLLKLLPLDFIERRASLLNLKALIFCYSYNFEALIPILKQVEDLLATPDSKMSDQLRKELESELAFMWGIVLFYWSADGVRCLEKLNLAIEIGPKEHTLVQGYALEHLIYANQMIGHYQEALELAERANEKIAMYGHIYMVRIQFSLMVVHLSEGNLQKAEQAAKLALKHAQEHRLPESICWLSQGLGYIYYQWNDLESARLYYTQALEYRYLTSVQAQALAFYSLARTLQALGEVTDAHEVSQSALEWAEEVGDARMLAEARALRARLALLNGQSADTHSWATVLGENYSPMIFIEAAHLSLAAVLIAQGTTDSLTEAENLLTSLHEFCVQTHNIWHLAEIIPLEALLFNERGEQQKALAKLEEAIKITRPGGYLRVFVDLGTPMHALLTELRQKEIEPGYLDRILKAFPSGQSAVSRDEQADHPDPLTRREAEILELLAQRLSNREIAEQLVLSPGTVKQHLYNIYKKLHVKSRRQAVTEAEYLGILPKR